MFNFTNNCQTDNMERFFHMLIVMHIFSSERIFKSAHLTKIQVFFFFFLILRAANFQCSFLFFLQLGGSGSHFLITGLAIENRPRCSGLFPPTPDALKRISLEHQVHKFGLSSGKGAAAGKNALKENWFLVFGFCFSPAINVEPTNYLLEKQNMINI